MRLKQGLTQEELAQAANTTKQTISKYESGIIKNIPADKIKAIADKLSTTPDYLMGWHYKPNSIMPDTLVVELVVEQDIIEKTVYKILYNVSKKIMQETEKAPNQKEMDIGAQKNASIL